MFYFLVQPEVPQLFDYLNGFYLDCYECHSNRPGCGEKVDWILMRWKRCVAPGGSKCVKIIERSSDGKLTVEFCLIAFKLLSCFQEKSITFVVASIK